MLVTADDSSPALVDPAPGQSRYGALAAALRSNILRGEWAPGAVIPAETQLAATYGVALGTMRQALGLLVSEGLLERVHGRGTFVSSGIGGASLLRFFRFRRTATESPGGVAQAPTSKILSRRTVRAPAEVAEALAISPGRPVLALTRVRLLDDSPCLHESIWLPLPQCSPLAALDKGAWEDLLYPMLQRLCGITVHRAEDTVTFAPAAPVVADALGLPAHAACARVSRRAFDMAGRCVELRHSFGDANSFQYTAHLR